MLQPHKLALDCQGLSAPGWKAVSRVRLRNPLSSPQVLSQVSNYNGPNSVIFHNLSFCANLVASAVGIHLGHLGELTLPSLKRGLAGGQELILLTAGAMVANPEDIDIDVEEGDDDEEMAEEADALQEKTVPVSTSLCESQWRTCKAFLLASSLCSIGLTSTSHVSWGRE